MKKLFLIGLSALTLGACSSSCGDDCYEYSDARANQRVERYEPQYVPVQQQYAPQQRYVDPCTVQPQYRQEPCVQPQAQAQQARRAIGTVYEVTTYETRYEARTVPTGTYRQTEYYR